MSHILVVDDEPAIREVVRAYLERAGHVVRTAADGAEADAAFAAVRPDLVVLDLMLPRVDGFELLRRWRAQSRVPVLVLTARTDETDAVVALRLGADDYVRKPFSPAELTARIDALLRRAGIAGDNSPAQEERLVRGPLELDPEARQVWIAGQPVSLTATEFELLHALARAPGRVFSRAQLLRLVRGDEWAGERTIDTHLKNLRHKLGDDPSRPRWIETVQGVGYRFVAEGK